MNGGSSGQVTIPGHWQPTEAGSNITTTITTTTTNNNNKAAWPTAVCVMLDGWMEGGREQRAGNYTRSLTAREAGNINTITTTTTTTNNNNNNNANNNYNKAARPTAVCVMLDGGIGQVTILGR